MLWKTDGDFERRIACLPGVLAPPASPFPSAKRDALHAARSKLAGATGEYGATAKRLGGASNHPELDTAAQRVRDLEQEMRCAADKFRQASEAREREFATAVLDKIDEAKPTLVELCRLMETALDPILRLRQFAALNNLPPPTCLHEAAYIAEGINALRRLLNVTPVREGMG